MKLNGVLIAQWVSINRKHKACLWENEKLHVLNSVIRPKDKLNSSFYVAVSVRR